MERLSPATPSSAQDVWHQALLRLQERLGRPGLGVEMFLKSARAVNLDHNGLLLAVPNLMAKQWVEERYLAALREELYRVLGRPLEVRVVVADDPTPEERPAPSRPAPTVDGMHLSPRYTFDTFVVGSGNRFAHAAAVAVA
ncbi:MAG: DnaA N-terminal domain-containing protein, partial [Armatimonadota bacterium]|nr:DnaA N-terminal domain-containing protein [Armatimonadota bacterium]